MLQDVSTNPRYVDIGTLPSYFLPYSFSKLHIRPFTIAELRLLAYAVANGTMEPMIKAVDLCIDQPIDQIAIGDFFYILMWLRINSYPKSPWEVAWTCNNMVEDVVEVDEDDDDKDTDDKETPVQVEEKEPQEPKFKRCGWHNAALIQKSTIEILDLEALKNEGFVLDEELDYPRVPLLVDLQSLPSTSPDLLYIIPAVQWVRKGKSLAEKIEALELEPDLSLFSKANDTNKKLVFGVKERMLLKCSKCGHGFMHTMAIEPLTFFRQV